MAVGALVYLRKKWYNIAMKRTVYADGRALVYELERKPVKNLNLRVKSDGTVCVSAHNRVDVAKIDEFVLSKAKFIFNARARLGKSVSRNAFTEKFCDGEVLQLFGEKKVLRVCCGQPSVTVTDREIVLTVRDVTGDASKRNVIDKWLRARFEETATAVCKMIFPVFSRYGVSFPQIKFRKMRSRWGSCNPSRKIVTFNYALVSAPLDCIEYVAVHEFCHFLHPDHSAAFYACLTAVLPDWKRRKKLLNATCSAFC